MKAARAVSVVALMSGALLASAQTPVPTPRPTPFAAASSELAINATTSGGQETPVVAMAADHGFVVAWRSEGQDGDSGGIFARRFDRDGAPLGNEFQVNETTTGDQRDPSIAADLDGNFVLVWASPDPDGNADVFARRYGSAGNPLGGEFQVNTYTTGDQADADVSVAGDFVVVWSSVPTMAQPGQDGDQGGIYARRYDAAGNPIGDEFLVNDVTAGDQREPRVSFFHWFNVIWQGPDADGTGIFARRYDLNGVPYGPQFQVNTYTPGDQAHPDIDGLGSPFFAAWMSSANGGAETRILAQSFGPLGNPLGPEFQVNTQTPAAESRPRVARDASVEGDFVVAWEGQDDPADPATPGVFAQRFHNQPFPTTAFFLANPSRQGSEYQVNMNTTGSQSTPDVAMNQYGRFVVVWNSSDGVAGSEIIARRFNRPIAAPMRVDAVLSGGVSNVNGVLEAGERVVVAPTWINTEGTPLPLTGTASNIVGPDGPTYQVDDATADYATIFENPLDCLFGVVDCYEISVSGSRPAAHWDATFDETLASPSLGQGAEGMKKTWPLHVGGSFADVPMDVFYPFIENLFHNGVTAGGACGAGLYCGEDVVLRRQMAVFLLKAAHGPAFAPPEATGTVFADVSQSDPFAPWIEQLSREGITGGCGGGNFCPAASVTRQQMSAFLLKTLFGPSYAGEPCLGTFEDLPCSSPFAPYVQALVRYEIAAGCQASPPLYCPLDPTKRKQMAVFLVKTFGLELYGPD
jgi:hypothetical protein